jgi:WD40 repeat protein/transcriptional regulator with XRE-family HTH domain
MGWRGPYRPRKFEVGERLLAFRTRAKLTQAELAELIGVSRRSVQSWEAGISYPQEDKLRRLISILLTNGALLPGQEYEEALSLWQQVSQDAPRRLAPFDEKWFNALLASPGGLDELVTLPVVPSAYISNPAPTQTAAQPSSFIDWGEAPEVSKLYGREAELATLEQWIFFDRCRVVALLGLGGIGKTSLAVNIARNASAHFDLVLFRSLRNAPRLSFVLDTLIHAVSADPPALPESVVDKIALLIQLFRERRCLVVLDNLETILQPGAYVGEYRAGYEEYGLFLQRLGEISHQSCLLLTSREKPAELGAMEGHTAPVRTLALTGLTIDACRAILAEKELSGTAAEFAALTDLYGGNPLALKLVSEPIHEVFSGNLALFLSQGDAFFNGVGKLLSQQFQRSTMIEQVLLYWLAIERDFTTLEALQANAADGLLPRDILVGLESLRRRLLVERHTHPPAFSLQPVIMEYVTDQLVERIRHEVLNGQPRLLRSHAFVQAMAKDYVRQTQEQLIATPLIEQLVRIKGGAAAVEQLLLAQLEQWRGVAPAEQAYGPGNVVNLLRLLRGNLRSLNLGGLSLRQAYLQGVEMQDSSLERALVQDSRFTEAMGVVHAVAASPTYWAMSSGNGMLQIWRDQGRTKHLSLNGHDKQVITLAFSPTAPLLASGSYDCIIKLWDLNQGSLMLRLVGHTDYVQDVAFSPDGAWLASASDDQTVRIWDVATGHSLQTIHAHNDNAYGVSWSPDGRWLASGGFDHLIHIWDVHKGRRVKTFAGHTHHVMKVAFSPDGTLLASASADQTVRIWEVASARCLHIFSGHSSIIKSLTWSQDGELVASSGEDGTIRLWNLSQKTAMQEVAVRVLQAHTGSVNSVAFTTGRDLANSYLLSGSDDHTVRVWDVASGACVQLIQGHGLSLYSVAYSPDSRYLLSANSDTTLALWDVEQPSPLHILRGHTHPVYAAGWSADGKWLASGGYDQTIRIWDAQTRDSVRVLQGHSDIVYRTVWHPTSHLLASASVDQTVRLWDAHSGQCLWIGDDHTSPVNEVVWSPDGEWLASCSADRTVRIWRAQDGTLVHTLAAHNSSVAGVAWSPNGRYLASCGGGGADGELLLWDAASGQHLHAFAQLDSVVFRVAWSLDSKICVSGGINGAIQWWDVERKVCLRTKQAHQGWIRSLKVSPDGATITSGGEDGVLHLWDLRNGELIRTFRIDRPYERMDITGITGVTDAQKATLLALGATTTEVV